MGRLDGSYHLTRILVIILSWPGTSHWIIIYVTEPRRPHDTAQLHNPEEMPQIKQGRANCKSDCRNFAWSEVAFDRISSVGSPRHLCQLQASQWRWWESCDLSCWHLMLTLSVDTWLLTFTCLNVCGAPASCRLVFTRIINFLIVHYCHGNRGNEVGVARKLPSLLLTLQGLMSGVAVTLPDISLNVISCQLRSQLSHTLR